MPTPTKHAIGASMRSRAALLIARRSRPANSLPWISPIRFMPNPTRRRSTFVSTLFRGLERRAKAAGVKLAHDLDSTRADSFFYRDHRRALSRRQRSGSAPDRAKELLPGAGLGESLDYAAASRWRSNRRVLCHSRQERPGFPHEHCSKPSIQPSGCADQIGCLRMNFDYSRQAFALRDKLRVVASSDASRMPWTLGLRRDEGCGSCRGRAFAPSYKMLPGRWNSDRFKWIKQLTCASNASMKAPPTRRRPRSAKSAV